MPRISLNASALGGFLAALGVLLGAFGAHALSTLPAARLAWWHTGTQYLFIAAFGMMFGGRLDAAGRSGKGPLALLGLGALLFSGSLYAMALGAPRFLGAITPVGGIALVVGFGWMGLRALRVD